jgi:hypothetical protein
MYACLPDEVHVNLSLLLSHHTIFPGAGLAFHTLVVARRSTSHQKDLNMHALQKHRPSVRYVSRRICHSGCSFSAQPAGRVFKKK